MTDQEPELVDVTEAVADSSLPPEEPAAAEDHAADGETVEQAERAVHDDLGRIAAERDEFRALAQRVQADFENYKKRMIRQQTDHLERAAQGLVDKLLPVLDAFDLAVAHGEGVEQLRSSLLGVL